MATSTFFIFKENNTTPELFKSIIVFCIYFHPFIGCHSNVVKIYLIYIYVIFSEVVKVIKQEYLYATLPVFGWISNSGVKTCNKTREKHDVATFSVMSEV